MRTALSWLGDCQREQAGHSVHLVFRFAPEAEPTTRLKLKIEINTREHLCVLGLKPYSFSVNSRWFQGTAQLVSFEPEELFGTKLRALLQRRKNRDLFDLSEGLKQLPLDCAKVIQCFQHYLGLEGTPIHRAAAEERMLRKLDRSLTDDIVPLLPPGISFNEGDALLAFASVWNRLITGIEGDAWKLSEKVISQFRSTRFPEFLR